MELIHRHGWRILELPRLDGDGSCFRLCRWRRWLGDYRLDELTVELAVHDLRLIEFSRPPMAGCHTVDPASRLACARPATWLLRSGGGAFRFCEPCRDSVRQMRAAPWPAPADGGRAPGHPELPGVDDLWLALGSEERREWLSSQVRVPMTKILGYAELLTDEPQGLDADRVQMLRAIHRSARGLCRLLDDVSWAV